MYLLENFEGYWKLLKPFLHSGIANLKLFLKPYLNKMFCEQDKICILNS